jgi:mitochondrial import inner membrane translocase subunit TIM50
MAFIETNKPEFDRMLEKEKEAMAKQMPDNLLGMLGVLGGAGKQPGGQETKEGEAAVAVAAGGKEKGKA